MKAHRKILALTLAIFDRCFVYISVKYRGIDLEILPQPPRFGPNICSKFQPI